MNRMKHKNNQHKEEKQEIKQMQTQQREIDLGNSTANNFIGYLKQMKRGNDDLAAITKSLFKRAANKVKDNKEK